MDATEGLEGFVEILNHGSLTAAARAMGVPRSTLSRQLSRLEERLGVRLVHRTTRRVVATPLGEELYAHARRVVEDARAALEAVRRLDDVPRGRLRVSTVPMYDALVAEPLLSFADAWPEVELEVDAALRVVDLVAEGFDVAIRGRPSPQQDVVSRPLLRSDTIAVASPDYLARRGRPERPSELSGHDLVLGYEVSQVPQRSWPLRSGGSVPVSGRIVGSDVVFRRAAALSGRGITLLPLQIALGSLREGTLERVLPDRLGRRAALSLVYPERAFLLPRVRAFVDHMLAWAATLPHDACAAVGPSGRASP